MKTKSPFIFFVFSICAFAQWSTSPDPDSSLYVCPGFTPTIRTMEDGSSFIFGMSSYNLWLQKLDPFGYKQWTQPTHVYQNAGSNSVYTIPTVLDNVGGIIMWWRDDRNAELDQSFNFTQNALYMQRINKFGQKMWPDTGIQIASINGGRKGAYGVDDGANGIVILLIENDFYRVNKTNKEYHTLIRYNALGIKEWATIIDSSGTEGILPDRSIYRIKNQILYFTMAGPQLIDTNGITISQPSYKNYGEIIFDDDSTLLSLHSYSLVDSSNHIRLKLELTKLSTAFDSLWSSTFISSDSVYLGDGGSSVIPYLLPDYNGGLFYSYGYYVNQPRRFNIFIQRINKDGGVLTGDGLKFMTSDWPILAFTGKDGIGLVYFDNSFQKYNLQGDSLFQQRTQVFNKTQFDIDNETIESDKNGGAIIAFWRGGIFAQHTGRTGKLGQITPVKIFEITPQNFALKQNYPNPFNASTIIEYKIPNKEKVILKIYDLIGREIAIIQDGILEAGTYRTSINASLLASGVYFYRLQVKNNTQIKKMTLVK